jgi:uncharacterized OB-fold protein
VIRADDAIGAQDEGLVAAIPQIRLGSDRKPHLFGERCGNCKQVYFEARIACPRCFCREPMQPVELSRGGKLYSFTIVHRSFPGVRTPFVMAIVDLDDGLAIRGTLEDIDPSVEAIAFDLPVRLEFRHSAQQAAGGGPYLTFVFVPDRERAK